MTEKTRRHLMFGLLLLLLLFVASPLYAAGEAGDVAAAIESTWKSAAVQIKAVVNNVIFPAIDLILAVFFFAKLAMVYFDYRKHGQFEWQGPASFFA